MFKNALISVSDKNGLIDFLKPLVEKGLRLVSTGGTAKHLRDHGFRVIDVSEQTGFPEVMDGRVKTLHPNIHMPILARMNGGEDEKLLASHGLEPFDLIIVNLYPFAEAKKRGLKGDELIEFIDIGGPSLLRAAAKNFSRQTVITDPNDYKWIKEKNYQIELKDRKHLSAKVFAHTSAYDALIAQTLSASDDSEAWPELWTVAGQKHLELRYGENPQQSAAWYRFSENLSGLHQAEILQGKPLSFNNLLDLEAASLLVRELEGAGVVAVKHNNPCGVAIAKDLATACEKAIAADPVSVFGGILAFNKKLNLETVKKLSDLFLECLVAPEIDEEAKVWLSKKKNLRVLIWPGLKDKGQAFDIKTINGGFLIQKSDSTGTWQESWKIFGEAPNENIKKDLLFSWHVVASLKSNAIAIISEQQTVGVGMGQVNRVDAVKQAIERMKHHHPNAKNLILASDAFFPFKDSIEVAAQAGVKWIIQPGGSIKDEEVLNEAKKQGISMIMTGERHFRH